MITTDICVNTPPYQRVDPKQILHAIQDRIAPPWVVQAGNKGYCGVKGDRARVPTQFGEKIS